MCAFRPKVGQCHPALATSMLCVSCKQECNIFPFEFMYPRENHFSHPLKILGQKNCFLGPKSHILGGCYDCVSFAVNLLIFTCSLPQNFRAEITHACVHPKSYPAHRTAVVVPHVGITTIIGGRARGRICPIIQSTITQA